MLNFFREFFFGNRSCDRIFFGVFKKFFFREDLLPKKNSQKNLTTPQSLFFTLEKKTTIMNPFPSNPFEETDEEKCINSINELPVSSRSLYIHRSLPSGHTPLITAIKRGHHKLCKLLLSYGSGVNKTSISSGKTPLHYAVKTGDLAIFNMLILAGANINKKTCFTSKAEHVQETPLGLASRKGFSKFCKLLLEKNASVDCSDALQKTPLFIACEMGHEQVLEVLLRFKPNVNYVRKFYGDSPLYITSKNGHKNICEKLINAGADPNSFQNELCNSTPLIAACRHGHKEVCQLLISRGAKVNRAKANNFFTALHVAVDKREKEIVELLLDNGADISLLVKDGMNALHLACRSNELDICKMLLSRGIDATKKCIIGRTPLFVAVEESNEGICELLLSYGVDPNRGNGKIHSNPLNLSIERGSNVIFKMLLEHGADPNKKEFDKTTPLQLAVNTNSEEMCKELISKGVLVDEPSSVTGVYVTPLFTACYYGFKSMCKLLIDNNANLNQLNYGCSESFPLYAAAKGGFREICDLLLTAGADVNLKKQFSRETALFAASKRGHEEVCSLLTSRGAQVDHRNNDDETPLLIAVKKDHLEVCRTLLSSGADVNQVDKYGCCLLEHAIGTGELDLVSLLIHCGADPNPVNRKKGKFFPLSFVCGAGYYNMARLLIKHGADIEHKDQDGKTPLHYAVNFCHVKVVITLINSGAKVKEEYLAIETFPKIKEILRQELSMSREERLFPIYKERFLNENSPFFKDKLPRELCRKILDEVKGDVDETFGVQKKRKCEKDDSSEEEILVESDSN